MNIYDVAARIPQPRAPWLIGRHVSRDTVSIEESLLKKFAEPEFVLSERNAATELVVTSLLYKTEVPTKRVEPEVSIHIATF